MFVQLVGLPGCGKSTLAAALERIEPRVRRVPEELARRKAKATSAGHEAWRAAREARDFALFSDSLHELVEICREEATAIALGPDPLDPPALLQPVRGVRELLG